MHLRRANRLIIGISVLCTFLCAASSARATNYVWAAGDTGGNWNDAANWSPNTTYPNQAGDVVRITNNITGTRTINLNQAITVGQVYLWDDDNGSQFVLAPNGGSLTFDVSSGEGYLQLKENNCKVTAPIIVNDKTIIWDNTGALILEGDVTANDTLEFRYNNHQNSDHILSSVTIDGPGEVRFFNSGGYQTDFPQMNLHTGATVVGTSGGNGLTMWGSRGYCSNTVSFRVANGNYILGDRIGGDDDAANNNVISRINPSAPLYMGATADHDYPLPLLGGTFNLTAPQSGNTHEQEFSKLHLDAGWHTIQGRELNAGSVVNVKFTGTGGAGYTRGGGGVVNFADTTAEFHPSFVNAPTEAGGSAVRGSGGSEILAGALLNETDFVKAQAGDVAATTYTTQNNAALWGQGGNTNNITVNGAISGSASNGTINAIRFESGCSGNATIAGGYTLTVDSGNVLFKRDMAIQGDGALTSGNGADLVFMGNKSQVYCKITGDIDVIYALNGSDCVISGINDYTGDTWVIRGMIQTRGTAGDNATIPGDLYLAGGSLKIWGADEVFSDNCKLTFLWDGTADMLYNETIGSLQSTNGLGNVDMNTITLGLAGTNIARFDGVVYDAGSGHLVYKGTGVQILSGDTDTYSGRTTIQSGALYRDDTHSGSGRYYVWAGATLGGSGSIAGIVTNNGTLAPGSLNGYGNLLVSDDVVFGNDSAFSVGLSGYSVGDGNGTYDQLRMTAGGGKVELGSGVDLTVSVDSGFDPTNGAPFFVLTREDAANYGDMFEGLEQGSNFNVGVHWFTITTNANWTGSQSTSTTNGGNDVALVNLGWPYIKNESATNVTAGGASLNGNLQSTGDAPTYVWLYWGKTDEGTDRSAWANTNDFGQVDAGWLTTNITATAGGYYYRFFASNAYGQVWATNAESFALSLAEVSLEATDIIADEIGNTGEFTLGRSLVTTNVALTLYYTVSGTASNGVDYSWLSGSLLFAENTATQTITITPNNDYIEEEVETLTLTLAPGSYFIGAQSTGTVNIVSSDLGTNSVYRMKIVFDGYDPGDTREALTNFPALITFSNNIQNSRFDYRTFIRQDGYGLRFWDSDETRELNYEIEEWDTNDTSYVWVEVPVIDGTNSYIWAIWGDSAEQDQEAYTTNGYTWTNGFVGVWHLKENQDGTGMADVYKDSTSNTNHGDDYVSAPHQDGIVNGGQEFDNSDDYINVADSASLDITTAITMETFGKFDTVGQDGIIEKSGAYWFMYNGIQWRFDLTGVGGYQYVTTPTVGQWYHAAATYDGTTKRITENGILRAEQGDSGSISTSANPLTLGEQGGNEWDGYLDEIRISNVARSTNWLYATWLNIASNGVFNTYCPLEFSEGPAVNNSAGASSIANNNADLNGYVVSTGNVPTTAWVFWGDNDGSNVFNDWDYSNTFGLVEIGALVTNVTGLKAETEYFYRFYATNSAGEAWAATTTNFFTLEGGAAGTVFLFK